MNNKSTFYIGILGASLFVISSILGGILIDGYNEISQLISESYAIDTEYGEVLRFFAIIPSGILLTLFSFLAYKKLPRSKLTKWGFLIFGICYGIATVIVGIFPCDSGCNKEFINPSLSQIIHNLSGSLTYMFVPLSMILIGIALSKFPTSKKISRLGITCGIVGYLFVFLFISEPTSDYIGLYQRIIESVFILWIISYAFHLRDLDISG